MAGHAGHDINYIALTGALHGIGTAESPIPPLNLVGDYGGGGMLLAVGLLSAILEARESGEGQVLDVAMIDGVATLLAPYFGMVPAGNLARPSRRQPARRRRTLLRRLRHRRRPPLRGRRDGAEVLRRTLRSPRRRRAARRRQPAAPGPPTARRWPHASRSRPRDEWEQILDSPGCCATPVLSLSEAPRHPHLVARETFLDLDGSTAARAGPAFLPHRPARAVVAVAARRPHPRAAG